MAANSNLSIAAKPAAWRARVAATIRGLLAYASLMSLPLAWGATWRIANRGPVEGELSGVYQHLVVIAHPPSATVVTVDELDTAGLERVADFLATRAAKPAAWRNSTSAVAKATKGQLQVLRQDRLAKFEPGDRPEPEFYLVYFASLKSEPSRVFTPLLLEAYERLKLTWPGRFEVIFFSNDQTHDLQVKHMREARMPWLAVKFAEIDSMPALFRWAGAGVPCLAVITRENELLYHSYQGTEYIGARAALAEFEALLQAAPDRPGPARRAWHRLAVIQHVRSVGKGSHAPQAYLQVIDRSLYQTMAIKDVAVTLALDDQGRVTAARIEPSLPSVLHQQLREDAEGWLYLPAVKDGKPRPATLVVPLKF